MRAVGIRLSRDTGDVEAVTRCECLLEHAPMSALCLARQAEPGNQRHSDTAIVVSPFDQQSESGK